MLSKDDNSIQEALVKSLLPKVKNMDVEEIRSTINSMGNIPEEFKLAILNEILVVVKEGKEED